MALTKLPKNAFGTGSVDDSKIEDGTIQAVEISGTIDEGKIATGTIANAKLSTSSITFNGTSRSLGDSFSLTADVNWQSVITADGSTGTTAVAGNGYFIDTTSASHTLTLPSSASIGDTIAIKDYAGTFGTNVLVINRNGHKIQGVENNHQIETNRASIVLVYVDTTKGWLYTEEHNVADLQANSFISATGGTITTSGDFKIHTFTGDGCFVVSTLGLGPAGGPSNVDYLVVAGGASGGSYYAGGGGGAGGYRTSFPSPDCNAGAFPISATTYPITVGAGGAARAGCASPKIGNPGSNSVFSTITSTGGGYGGSIPNTAGGPGGSGGGGGDRNNTAGGTGNTPPTSPSQGNNGGTAKPETGGAAAAGGGGGATVAGSNGSGPSPGTTGPQTGGPGGAGATNAITGSPTAYAGGGGGGVEGSGSGSPNTAGSGGAGGGGAGGNDSAGTAGTVNTGGGGGGAGNGPAPTTASGAGGKGIVVIRYKYQ